MFVPYDTLTAKEKEKYRHKAYELLRFIQFSGFVLNKAGERERKREPEVEFCQQMLNPSHKIAAEGVKNIAETSPTLSLAYLSIPWLSSS